MLIYIIYCLFLAAILGVTIVIIISIIKHHCQSYKKSPVEFIIGPVTNRGKGGHNKGGA